MIQHVCRSCGNPYTRFNSLQRLCPTCQFNRLEKPRKPMKRLGKVGKAWAQTRKEWIEENPADGSGHWSCYLHISSQCLKFVDADSLTLDHIQSRSRRPDLRHDKNNLRPACMPCNSLKGSRGLEEIERK